MSEHIIISNQGAEYDGLATVGLPEGYVTVHPDSGRPVADLEDPATMLAWMELQRRGEQQ